MVLVTPFIVRHHLDAFVLVNDSVNADAQTSLLADEESRDLEHSHQDNEADENSPEGKPKKKALFEIMNVDVALFAFAPFIRSTMTGL